MSNLQSKEQPKEQKEESHLTSDLHIRYRGHPSEMIPPKNEHLDTNFPYRDRHDKHPSEQESSQPQESKITAIPHHEPVSSKVDTPGEKHLTSDLHIRYRGHPSEMIPPQNERLDTNLPYRDIHDVKPYKEPK
jgi:hypothetical protein